MGNCITKGNSREKSSTEICNGQGQVGDDSENVFCEDGQSSESVTNVSPSNGTPNDNESSDS
ncbi:hypothetical protein CCACVL1_25971 [Corchorus capsularis]|uniref:Uncharacterized protein n=1 Tax=Corchorus capsularis TaxID=210143 RepID=A0A1R3GGB6_COCAP|nr:hypothetical protein CCACVL1_25971 [Corchorus capsularis]